jgi:NAD(P)-dependent dehydrogenase (short-subunit alcohol dehydrogenase family)
MELGVSGKSVLVTGGSKGIGREICRTFLAEAIEAQRSHFASDGSMPAPSDHRRDGAAA